MGLRFRRSIKIAPGLRLNLSPSGLSASIGPRGASVSIGQRGTYLNTGLPGTGLSYRQRLTRGQERSESRSAYRTLRDTRDAQRAEERQQAAATHAEHEMRLAALRELLVSRNRDEYRWEQVWASRGSFLPTSAPVLAEQNIEELSRSAASAAVPIARWVIPILGLAVSAAIWGGNVTRGLAGLGVVLTCGWVITAMKARRTIAESHSQVLQAELIRDREALERSHASELRELEQEWAAEEGRLTRIRNAPINGDLEIMSGVLEAELENEPVPVPLIVELELNSIHDVKLEFMLPDLDEVPEARTTLTKTGKLSTRNMSQRDRVALYNDLCTGLALRLVNETLRVLSTVDVVEVFGIASGIDPATGHQSDFVSLHLQVSRSQLTSLNFDAVDPSSSFEVIGGSFLCDRKGGLMPLPGLLGLQD